MFKDKAAIITGGSRGIGKACALVLAGEGADVAIVGTNRDRLEEAHKGILALGGRALAIEADVADPERVEAMVETVLKEFGKVDILVNNAGITRDNLLIRMKKEEWDAVLAVNLTGTFLCTKSVARNMIKNRSGRIINITSIIGVMGNAGQTNYSASKAGIIGFTKSIARELAPRGITVNALAPGFIDTDMTRAMPEKAREEITSAIPLRRLGSPMDVAHCVKFLASDEADYITGQVIHVNGGMWM